MDDELLTLVKHYEGLKLTPYLCPAGYPTIGYGHRVPSLAMPPITEAQATALLLADLQHARNLALLLAPGLTMECRRLNALTDLVFNVGDGALHGSSVVRYLNAQNWTAAAQAFRQWDHAHVHGHLVELPGLKARREVGARWIEQGGGC